MAAPHRHHRDAEALEPEDDLLHHRHESAGGTFEHAGARTYKTCGQTDWTGLTVGWGDRYGCDLTVQEIDLNGLANGYYWRVSTADLQGRLTETDETNNCAAVKIEIRGTYVYERGQKIPC